MSLNATFNCTFVNMDCIQKLVKPLFCYQTFTVTIFFLQVSLNKKNFLQQNKRIRGHDKSFVTQTASWLPDSEYNFLPADDYF